MGLFSSKKIITVSSTVYNMAGDEKDRPNYLKSLVIRNVLSGTKDSMADTLNRGYLKGPAMKFRSFFRWASKPENYWIVGIPTGSMNLSGTVKSDSVKAYIPHAANTSVWVQSVDGGRADYSYWVEQWIFQNRLAKAAQEYFADIDSTTGVISIEFTDGEKVSFTPANYDINGTYIYAYYNEVNDTNQFGSSTGAVTVNTGWDFPSVDGWSFGEIVSETTKTVQMARTVRETLSYSDGRPSETSTSSTPTSDSYVEKIQTFYKQTSTGEGTNPNRDTLNATRETMRITEKRRVYSETQTFTSTYPAGNVTVTHTTQVTDQRLTGDNEYTTSKQNVVTKEWSSLKLFIYKLGSGIPGLDAALSERTSKGEFFPIIPLRMANLEVKFATHAQMHTQAVKAYKKATGGKYQELQDKLNTNKNIKDIDNAYVVFGVSLNVRDQSCRRYIWEFMTNLMQSQHGGQAAYDAWRKENDEYAVAFEQWQKWRDSYANGGGSMNTIPPPEPKLPQQASRPNNYITIGPSTAFDVWYRITLTWNYIRKVAGKGQGKPGAKKGEIWFETGSTSMYQSQIYTGIGPWNNDGQPQGGMVGVPVVKLFRQIDGNNFEYMEIMGFSHSNHVYENKSTNTTAEEALADTDESGFIIPLHYETFRSISLKDASQMATADVFLVLNSYVIKKQRWYERGLFKILFVIVIAIVSVVFTGGAGIGLLGTHMAVGGALGLTGMTAAIVGSVANALAALVLSTLLEKVAVGIFGDAIGRIIAGIVGIALGSGALSGSFSGGFSMNWSTLFRPENLIKMTSAVGDGIAAGIMGNIRKMAEETTDFLKETKAKADNVEQAYLDTFGYGGGVINPLMLTDASKGRRFEPSDTFLTRTLMTGSDIADMSNNMINNYVEISSQLETAFS